MLLTVDVEWDVKSLIYQWILIFSFINCSGDPKALRKNQGLNASDSRSQRTGDEGLDPDSKNSGSDSIDDQTKQNTDPDTKEDPKAYLTLETQHDTFRAFAEDPEDQLAAICARNANKTNVLITEVCGNNTRPQSLVELQQMLGLNPNNSPFTFTGHSSSLVARNTSAINPRLIMFNTTNTDNDYVALGFVRGEQFAEIIVNNGTPNSADFFLAVFTQACNETPEGCSIGELLTPSIESNWTSFTLLQDEDLKNTIIDCKHCHQPEGVGTAKMLRMQELRNPWTHFFRDNNGQPGGRALLDDFERAHGTDEDYAGIPAARIRNSDPADLEDFVRAQGFGNQPNEFQTRTIRDEVTQSSPNQPEDNTVAGTSAQWETQYELYRQGNVIAVPYHDVKITEPELLEKFTLQYQNFKNGVITEEQMEDHRDIGKRDLIEKADMGFGVRPNEPGEIILTQACAQCHNSKLDQSLSRARFNVDMNAMAQKLGGPLEAINELNIAIERVRLGYTPERLLAEDIRFFDPKTEQVVALDHKGHHIKTMPPVLFRDLTDEQIDALVSYFEEQKEIFKNAL